MDTPNADYSRFLALRRTIMDMIRASLELDSHCKYYEGTVELLIGYPDYFEFAENGGLDEPDMFIIRLHCYVLGPARHYEWHGKTLTEALTKCERDINTWAEELEVLRAKE